MKIAKTPIATIGGVIFGIKLISPRRKLLRVKNRQNEIYLMGEKEMGICMPKTHKEAILRIYTTNPEKIKETKEIWATL